ncbi:hypothetical protein LG329_18220 [Virgibacillus necropolis]|uniref:TolB family protein n=1 Tax=Virgibacillus necropolis TaxID=163877 RepID=UPI00384A56CD
MNYPNPVRGAIAYTTNRGGQYDIWLFNLRNGGNVQLTNGLADTFSSPVWSPDSNKIAFVGRNRILYVIYLSAGSIAGIDQIDEEDIINLDWSPDSKKLTYTTRDQIVIYDVTSHQAQSIRQPNATDAQWFSTGRELLFQAPDENGTSQLYRISVNGTGKRQITQNTEGPMHEVELSPDDSFVLYTTPGVSISLIRTIELSTGTVFELEGGPLAKNYNPTWNPNSRIIAYSATAFFEKGYFNHVRTVGRRGENDRIHALSDCYATPVTWSPDGNKIAYLAGCTEQEFAHEMWLVDLNNSVPIRLMEDALITSLQWSPSSNVNFFRNQLFV